MESLSGTARLFRVIRLMAANKEDGMRMSDIASQTGMTPASVHRILKSLIEEKIVEQGTDKRYSLGLEFFALAASAGHKGGLKELARPVLLRLGSRLNDSVFLFVRNGYDAVCIDRHEGPFPIQTFTNDVGGRVALGVGQASMAILAYLSPDEQEEVLQYNIARLREYNVYDEISVRAEMLRVKEQGYCAKNSGLLEGVVGLAVPLFDCNGQVVGALSIATLTDRLNQDRLPVIVDVMKQEADKLSKLINPFDRNLRRPRF